MDVRTGSGQFTLEILMSTSAHVLGVLWLLGSVGSLTFGGFIHILPLIAVGMVLPRLIHGRELSE
jgi:hypothetical protein